MYVLYVLYVFYIINNFTLINYLQYIFFNIRASVLSKYSSFFDFFSILQQKFCRTLLKTYSILNFKVNKILIGYIFIT